MGDSPVIPPITTDLVDWDAETSRTSKPWYYYWSALGRAINALSGAIRFGPHNNRPNPGDVPIGSLYIEDAGAGYVVYELRGDGWHYIDGTNWGRISPDDRPTYLGVKDGGYTFRGTDQARTFVWSGTAWVETTPSWYGTHAARPAASTMAAGCLYAETDGGNQMYEVQVVSGSQTWVPVAGGGGALTTQSVNLIGAGRAPGVVFTNSTGHAIYIEVAANLTTTATGVAILTDSLSTPTTMVARADTNSVPVNISVGAWVMAGNNYQATIGSGSLLSWFEWT